MSQRPLVACLAVGVAACSPAASNGPTKEELEAAKNTVDCERRRRAIVIRSRTARRAS